MEIQRLEGQGVGNRMANYSERPKAVEPGGRKQLQIQKPGFQANTGVSCHYCLDRKSLSAQGTSFCSNPQNSSGDLERRMAQ